MKRKNLKTFFLFSLFSLLFFLGCSQEALYNNLNQEDANKVMVLLQQNGIPAELKQKSIQNETFWSIAVKKEDMSRARELIVTSQIISPRAPGLQEIYQAKGGGGWIKTPAEERARYLLALKGEIVNSLKKLPNVVDVDVVLNTPEQDDLGLREKKHPTASVVIKAISPKPGESSLNEIQVQQFVANSVEGMSPRDVSVLLHFMAPMGKGLKPGESVILPKGPALVDLRRGLEPETESSRLMGLKLDTASKERLKIYLIIFFFVLVVLSAALIVSIIQTSRTRHELKALRSGGEEHPALPEGTAGGGGAPRLESPEDEDEEGPME